MRVYRYLIVAVAALCIGLVLHATGALHVESGTWAPGPSMNAARTGAASVLLPDGRVLITGGSDADGNPLASAEFFNADGSLSDAPAMASARSGHAAVWLPTGYVLVAGGTTSGGGVTNSAELFDPLSNHWTTLPSTMVEARTDFTATVLRFGNVVIAGGSHAGVPVSAVEVFDISAETFSALGALNTARANAAAAAIADFKVIVAGGSDASGATLASTEVIDTEAGTVTAGPTLNSPRKSASATVLVNGNVLIAGGAYLEGAQANAGVAELASTDIYDPVAGTIAAGPSMSVARAGHQAFLLPNNNGVLLVGGSGAGQDLSSADLYSAGSFAAQNSMSAARKQATGAALYSPAFGVGTDGVLFVGGGSSQASSELYGFATVKTDKDDYAPGTPVIITGSGWVPGETVALSLLESPALDTHALTSVVADANGNIYSDEFAPDANDMGVRFYLTASGSKSVAQNTFKDADNTTTVITSSVNPANINQNVTFTATVTAGTNPETIGTVSFYNQTGINNPNCGGQTGTQIGSNQSLNTLGKASVTTSFATAGAFKIGACYNGVNGSTQNSQSPSITQNVAGKTNPTFTGLLGATTTYGDASVTLGGSFTNTPKPTGSVSITVNGVTQSATINGSGNFSSTFNPSAFQANAAGYTITYSYAGDASYNSASDTAKKLIVNKATLTITADDKNMAFGGTVPTLSYTPSGFVNGEGAGVLTGAPALSTTATSSSSAGPYPITPAVGTLTASNYAFTFVNGTLTVGKADVTVAWSNLTATYDGSPHTITATPTPSGAGLIITYTGTDNFGGSYNSTTGPINAGSYTATATLSDSTNYKFAAGALTSSPFTISKVEPTVAAVGGTFTYDTTAKTGSGTATGVGSDGSLTPVTLSYQDSSHNAIASAPINAGSYFVVAHFAGNGNYNAKDSAPVAITIDKADPVMAAVGGMFTYDATAKTGSGTATGVGSDGNLTPVTLSYQDLTHNAIASAPINAGSYFVVAHFAGNGNYNAKDSAPVAITIDKADPVIVVNGYTGVYDGNAHGASGTAKGVSNETLAGLDLGASFTDVPGGTANWVFTDLTGNYNNKSGTAAIVISKADATVSVSGHTVTYDAQPHGATGTATGVKGESLAGLSLGATFTDVPGGTAHWTFMGGTNYKDQSGYVAIVISKANAVFNVTGYTGTYDAAPHGASGTATGVGGANLSAGLSLGSTFIDFPGGTAHWTFTGGTNYNDDAGDVAIVISKANAVFNVTGYTGTYDATAHGASGSATGVGGANLSAGLSLGSTFIDFPGGTAHWTFTGGTNYNDDAGDVAIVINKANAVVNVSGYTGTYDAAAHGATGSATGVGSVPLPGLGLGEQFTDVPGGTAHWTFTGGTNYHDQSGDVAIVINKAMPTVHVSDVLAVFDGNPHPASGSVTGVGGASLGAATITYTPGGATAPVNAGSYAVLASFAGNGNYESASANATVTISKASSNTVVAFEAGPYIYRGSAFTATAHVTGAGGLSENLSPVYGGDCLNVSSANGCTASASYAGDANHDGSDDSKSITIEKAQSNVVISFEAGPYVYRGSAFTATAHATGAGGLNQVLTPTYGGDCVNVTIADGCTASASFAGDTNHEGNSNSASITILKATPVVHVNNVSVTYDANPHPTSGSVTGVGGADLGAAVITYTPGGSTAPVNAGSYPVLASYGGAANYNPASATATVDIAKADPTITVTGYSVIFDNVAHAATGSAKGVLGETLSGLNLSGTTHTLVGTYTDPWTFTDVTGNYNNKNGTVNDSIGKWTLSGFYQPVTTFTGGTVVWNIVKGGSTVPVKFNIYAGTVQRTDVASVTGGSIALYSVTCDTPGIDDIVDEVVNTGNTSLRFDGSQFIQNWQTPKGAGQCYLVRMTSLDGSKLQAYFKTK